MAIYHMESKIVSRGTGRSVVAASAYMSCSRLYNDYDGIQHDYTRKHGLVWQEVFLPPQAPREWHNREQLWNAVEATEKTKDSRLAREIIVALPVELEHDEQIALTRAYISQQFVADGMCADVAIHDTDGHNPHAHILLTMRPLNEDGTWQYKTEKEYLCMKDGEERGFTAGEYKSAQADGWEKQYLYRVGRKKVYMTPTAAAEHGYARVDKHPKSSRYGRQVNCGSISLYADKSDFYIDERERTSNGKGYRALYYAAFIYAIHQYLDKKQRKHFPCIMLDSPLTTLRGTEKMSQVDPDAVNGNIQTAMLSYVGTLDSVQSIILENKEIAPSIEEMANVIRFSGSKDEGRFGLFPV